MACAAALHVRLVTLSIRHWLLMTSLVRLPPPCSGDLHSSSSRLLVKEGIGKSSVLIKGLLVMLEQPVDGPALEAVEEFVHAYHNHVTCHTEACSSPILSSRSKTGNISTSFASERGQDASLPSSKPTVLKLGLNLVPNPSS
ncbi:hypothetical protein K466DRAFT_570997 [Polyporus arcularius HHB13444]|uniref:Uncharacterized protein n=1 Tax=Polyporus arcularius HHB13444 TaxID=1314778 RepID=A0A5C3NLT8_9APHY|nr:hypothetical protein K466DRAFT_570997 [Polyporus arcularius HHB13444]